MILNFRYVNEMTIFFGSVLNWMSATTILWNCLLENSYGRNCQHNGWLIDKDFGTSRLLLFIFLFIRVHSSPSVCSLYTFALLLHFPSFFLSNLLLQNSFLNISYYSFFLIFKYNSSFGCIKLFHNVNISFSFLLNSFFISLLLILFSHFLFLFVFSLLRVYHFFVL